MTPYRLVYITASKPAEAKKIGRILLKEKVAACVNICQKIESMYWWKGKVVQSQESVLIAKTHKKHMKALISLVKKNHSYTVPCIVSFSIDEGNPDFLKWIQSETSKTRSN